MNSDDLAFFCLVVDAGSIASAAVSAGCDASTISRRMSALEKSVGSRLFIRSGRGLSVSNEGEMLLAYAREVGTLIDKARVSIQGLQKQGPPLIHVVAQPTIAHELFGPLFHAVRARYPASQIHFSEARADAILGDLQDSPLDIAVMYRPEFPSGLSYEPLMYEGTWLIAPPGFELRPDHLTTRAFAEIPLILKSTQHGSRVFVQEACARLGCEPNVAVLNDTSINCTLELVASGCGCAILPLVAAQPYIAAGRVVAHSLAAWRHERCVALVTGRSHLSASDLWTLNGIIRKVVAERVDSGAWCGARLASPAEPVSPPCAAEAAAPRAEATGLRLPSAA